MYVSTQTPSGRVSLWQCGYVIKRNMFVILHTNEAELVTAETLKWSTTHSTTLSLTDILTGSPMISKAWWRILNASSAPSSLFYTQHSSHLLSNVVCCSSPDNLISLHNVTKLQLLAHCTALHCTADPQCQQYWLAVWLSGNALTSINIVVLRQTWLVQEWVTVSRQVNHLGT